MSDILLVTKLTYDVSDQNRFGCIYIMLYIHWDGSKAQPCIIDKVKEVAWFYDVDDEEVSSYCRVIINQV